MTVVWPVLVDWEKSSARARPDTSEFVKLMAHFDNDEVLRRFANLRLLEGVPDVFKSNPWNYELVRDAIARHIGIGCHDVALVGSARFGFSYARTKWLQPFEPGRSDYDFFVCNASLYEACAKDAQLFLARAGEDLQWQKSVGYVKEQLASGFLNHNVVLPREYYPAFRHLDETCRQVSNRYQRELLFSTVKLRVYPNWDGAMQRVIENLSLNLKRGG